MCPDTLNNFLITQKGFFLSGLPAAIVPLGKLFRQSSPCRGPPLTHERCCHWGARPSFLRLTSSCRQALKTLGILLVKLFKAGSLYYIL